MLILGLGIKAFGLDTTPKVSSETLTLSSLSLLVGPSVITSRVTGTGFNFNQSNSVGNLLGLGIKGQSKTMAMTLLGGYNRINADHSLSSAFTPSKISTTREDIFIYGLTQPMLSEFWSSFQFGFGYKFQNFRSDVTSPNYAFTDQSSQGLLLAVKNSHSIFEDGKTLDLEFKFYLPHKFHEKTVNTGFNPNFIGTEFQIKFSQIINPKWQFSTALIYQYDSVSFDGQGTRGTVSASDIKETLTIPLEFEYIF